MNPLTKQLPGWAEVLTWLLLTLSLAGIVQIIWMVRNFDQLVAYLQWLVYGGS